jgi:hypothetical protein
MFLQPHHPRAMLSECTDKTGLSYNIILWPTSNGVFPDIFISLSSDVFVIDILTFMDVIEEKKVVVRRRHDQKHVGVDRWSS